MDGTEMDDLGGEVWTGVASIWECDAQGHLNVRFYVAKAMEALAGLVAELGLPGVWVRSAETTLAVREIYVRYLREAHQGALLSMTGGVLEIGQSNARVLLIMRHSTGEPAAAFQCVIEHIDAQDRESLPWPQGFIERASARRVEAPPYAAARTLSLEPFETSASLGRAISLGLIRTVLTVVSAADCDAFGRLRYDGFLGKLAEGLPRLPGLLPPKTVREPHMAGASLEYRLVLFDPPHAGDRIEIRAGVVELTERHRQTIHWLLNPDTGRPWGVAANVGVSFNLDTRKMITRSPEELAAGQIYRIEGLSL